LLNDPIYVEAARVFALKAFKEGGGGDSSRISWAFERALGRRPDAGEKRILAELHRRSLSGYLRNPASARRLIRLGDYPAGKVNPARLAAMTIVTRAILNLHETITRN
jgi:hypothetical protein